MLLALFVLAWCFDTQQKKVDEQEMTMSGEIVSDEEFNQEVERILDEVLESSGHQMTGSVENDMKTNAKKD